MNNKPSIMNDKSKMMLKFLKRFSLEITNNFNLIFPFVYIGTILLIVWPYYGHIIFMLVFYMVVIPAYICSVIRALTYIKE